MVFAQGLYPPPRAAAGRLVLYPLLRFDGLMAAASRHSRRQLVRRLYDLSWRGVPFETLSPVSHFILFAHCCRRRGWRPVRKRRIAPPVPFLRGAELWRLAFRRPGVLHPPARADPSALAGPALAALAGHAGRGDFVRGR